MKLEIEINENQLMKHLEKAVKEYLDERALLGFLRDEINRMYKSTGRKDLSNEIRKVKQRLTSLEKKYDPIKSKVLKNKKINH